MVIATAVCHSRLAMDNASYHDIVIVPSCWAVRFNITIEQTQLQNLADTHVKNVLIFSTTVSCLPITVVTPTDPNDLVLAGERYPIILAAINDIFREFITVTMADSENARLLTNQFIVGEYQPPFFTPTEEWKWIFMMNQEDQEGINRVCDVKILPVQDSHDLHNTRIFARIIS